MPLSVERGGKCNDNFSASSTVERRKLYSLIHNRPRKDTWRVQLERRPSIYSQRRPSPHVSSSWNRILSSEGGLRDLRASVGANFYNTRDTQEARTPRRHCCCCVSRSVTMKHTRETVAFSPFLNHGTTVTERKYSRKINYRTTSHLRRTRITNGLLTVEKGRTRKKDVKKRTLYAARIVAMRGKGSRRGTAARRTGIRGREE